MFDQKLDSELIRGNSVFEDIIGLEIAKTQLRSALLAQRHVILVGPPGAGKTTLAKNIAKLLSNVTVMDCFARCDPKNKTCPQCLEGKSQKTITLNGLQRFIRIQGSPDLTAEDLFGDIDPIKALKFGPTSIEAFTPGKIFAANRGILFFDEINRCPEKLQNALLQVLEEGKVTLGAYELDFTSDFIFIGTMNPSDSSTEKLSDVFIDRFDFVNVGYPDSLKNETDVVLQKGKKILEYDIELLNRIVSFIRELRSDSRLEKVPGVRASIGLYERSQAHAKLNGKKKVALEDVLAVMESVLLHRIRLKPSARFAISSEEFLKKAFDRANSSDHGDGR